MGLKVTGMDEWLTDLRTLPERAPKAFRAVVSRAGVQIKLDWKARWRAISADHGHIPHLIRGVGYDVHEHGSNFSLEVGVDPKNRQAFLAGIVTYGTLTSAPHDAGQAALDVEIPKFERAVGKVAVDLLEGKA
jgi:hypothetical protein